MCGDLAAARGVHLRNAFAGDACNGRRVIAACVRMRRVAHDTGFADRLPGAPRAR